jgi:hypothetical protein
MSFSGFAGKGFPTVSLGDVRLPEAVHKALPHPAGWERYEIEHEGKQYSFVRPIDGHPFQWLLSAVSDL